SGSSTNAPPSSKAGGTVSHSLARGAPSLSAAWGGKAVRSLTERSCSPACPKPSRNGRDAHLIGEWRPSPTKLPESGNRSSRSDLGPAAPSPPQRVDRLDGPIFRDIK